MTSPDRTRPAGASITEPTITPPPYLPFGGLPVAESWRELTKNQLQLVVLEAQFTDVADPISASDGLLIRDAAVAHGLDQPRVESAVRHDVQVSLADDGDHVLSETVTKGWRYTVGDDALVAVLLPSALVVQTSTYRSFGASIGRPFLHLLSAVGEHLAPQALSRIGLRYVNRLTDSDATTPNYWTSRINPAFLGPVMDPTLSTFASTSQQQMELALEGSIGAMMRYGLLKEVGDPARWSFLVDIDVYDTGLQPWDPRATFEHARRLNATALTLFQHLVTSQYRDSLGPGEVPPRTEVTL